MNLVCFDYNLFFQFKGIFEQFNYKQSNNKFYNHITKLLQECDYFVFNVAFINISGLQLLLDSFKTLENKNIKGKILTSTYLNFTQVEALEKIKEFKNIELKFMMETISVFIQNLIFLNLKMNKILIVHQI